MEITDDITLFLNIGSCFGLMNVMAGNDCYVSVPDFKELTRENETDFLPYMEYDEPEPYMQYKEPEPANRLYDEESMSDGVPFSHIVYAVQVKTLVWKDI